MSLEILYNYEKSKIKNSEDAFVCFVHYCLISNGYKCIAKGEEIPKQNIKKSDMLPNDWSTDEVYALIYQHETSGDTYLLKIVKFDSMLLVHFLRTKDEKVSSIEVLPSDYVSSDLSSYETTYKNLDQFRKLFCSEIVGPFCDKSKTSAQQKVKHSPRNDQDRPDPLRVPSHRPGWEEHRNPVMIGRSDLDPLAGGMGGGMIFDPMRSGFPPVPPRGGCSGIGGPNRLPRGAVPPGARFDPYGPPDLDPSGGRNPDFRNQRAGPDPDHLPPPGYDDMFM